MGALPLVCPVGWLGGMPYDVAADDRAVPSTEFSGSLVKTVKGRHYHAQVFVKGDRFEPPYRGNRTDS